jgi:hypothetical protein|tara:strand:+ start:10085 stop:10822 length:738 start_codon:yes stop_codon:yes gene_type:complete
MIQQVYDAVLAILNKNNYGYLSPADFNLYAQQAQLDLFEDIFYQYNAQVTKENLRGSGTGYADIKKGIVEVIDMFSVTAALNHLANNTYSMPSTPTTGSDFYFINKVLCYDAAGVTFTGEAERVSQAKITLLNNSLYTAPTTTYPAYTTEGSVMTVYPSSIILAGQVQAQYIRYPATPQWTYVSLGAAQQPQFSVTASYQDFELPLDYFQDLVNKILQFAGMEIRDGEIVQFALGQEQIENQDEQ